ncbi:MAG: NADH-quinone oxidoreductase subunit N [Phycisphaerae bacterium]|nr:NADH-quinone oxidoreductase subunit N [Gemmatimonadaceae bacterium]
MTGLASPSAFVSALLPDLVLASGTLMLLLVSVAVPHKTVLGRAEGAERTSLLTRLALGLTILVGATVAMQWMNGAAGTTDQRIAGDGFRWAIDLIVIAGTAFTLMLIDAEHKKSHAFGPEIPILLLLSLSGMMLLAAARDLMLVFLGVELMSLAVYVLAAVNRRSGRGAEAAIKYFLLGAFSTGFMLYGMAMLFGATGSTRLADIASWNAANPTGSSMFLVGLGLLLVGFVFKIAAAPFHLWTPDVYDGAPLPVTAFMAAVVKTAAFAMFARVFYEALGGAVGSWHSVLWWLAALTMLVGNVFALAQKNLTRLVAYSSIAHAGYLLVALIGYSQKSSEAIIFYLVAYTLTTMGTFAVLVSVNGGRDQSPTMADVTGLWQSRPMLAVSMAVFMLSFLGLPVVGGMGFFAKWYVLQAALQASAPQTVLAVILVLSSVVSAGYYLSVVSAMFMQPRPEHMPVPAAPGGMANALIAITVVLLLILGVYPTPIAQLARRTAPSGAPGSMVSASPVLTIPATLSARP